MSLVVLRFGLENDFSDQVGIQVLELVESLNLVVDSLGVADTLADFTSSDQVLEFVLLIQVLEETGSLGLLSEVGGTLPGDKVLKIILLLQVLE